MNFVAIHTFDFSMGGGGYCPKGDFVLGGILSGGILVGGFCPGGFCLGGYCPETLSPSEFLSVAPYSRKGEQRFCCRGVV